MLDETTAQGPAMTRTNLDPLRTAIQGALLLVASLGVGAPARGLLAQNISIQLVPSATTLSGCAEEELQLTLRLINPERLEIGGYQAFLKFPAEQFVLIAYDGLLESENSYVQAPSPLGDGFRPCTPSADDPWDDGMGSDVVSVIVSLIDDQEGGAPPFTAPEADLGRFVFRATGAPSGAEGVVFQSNDTDCHPPFDQSTKVFSRQGETISVSSSESATVVVNESDRQLRFFQCEDRGSQVDLFWGFSSTEGVIGVRLFRNEELIANLLLTSQTSFADEAPLAGEVVYEAAILLEGDLEQEGCRLSCSPAFRFLRGDANGDGRINLTDSISILGHLFQGMPLECADAGDFNDTGDLNITDVVAMLEYLFQPGGALPPPPFPELGVDPTPDELVCR